MTTPKYQPKLDLTDWQAANTKETSQIMEIIAPELHSFVEEHAQLSALMDRVRTGYDRAVYEEALAAIGEELDHHFHDEEALILPRLANHIPSTVVGPIHKLKLEHQLIRKHHGEATELFRNSDNNQTDRELLQKMNLLAYLLKKHIEKEDHYFFPLVSLVLTAEEKTEIAAVSRART